MNISTRPNDKVQSLKSPVKCTEFKEDANVRIQSLWEF